jgi:hypothetical protein
LGHADFRVGGRIFATLASERQGFGNLMLTPEQQCVFVSEQPEVFLAVPGGWGQNGATHIRLERASEDILAGALRTAWTLRLEKNQRARSKPAGSNKRRGLTPLDFEAAQKRKVELRARLTSPDALASVKKRYGLDE